MKSDDFLYQQIVDRVAAQIRERLLKPGDKLTSVRALSKEQGVSISTTFKAYVELENRGLIEARPKSGYFVRLDTTKLPAMTAPTTPATFPKDAGVDDMIRHVYQTISPEGVVRLSLAAPDPSLIPLAKLNKSMNEAMRRSITGCTHYEDVRGNRQLREQIARQSFAWKGDVAADEIVTTHGCMEALAFCLKAVTKPGDLVAIESPTYFGIFNILKSLGLRAVEIPVDAENGVELDHLEDLLAWQNVAACLFVTNFSNPIGSMMPDENKKRLVNMLSDRDIPLIEDDIYGEMYFGKSRPSTCKSFDTKGLVLLCSSVSKSLAPGYRVGWCMPGRFVDQIINIKLMHTVSATTPTQAAIAHFFETGRYDLHMRNLRKSLHTQSLQYLGALNDYFPQGTAVSSPQGGYVLWIALPGNTSAMELFDKAIAEKISIAPGHIFSTDARFSNYIRISFGSPYNSQINNSLKRLGALALELCSSQTIG